MQDFYGVLVFGVPFFMAFTCLASMVCANQLLKIRRLLEAESVERKARKPAATPEVHRI